MSEDMTVWRNGESDVLAVLIALVMVTSLVAAVPLASADTTEVEPNDSREEAQRIQSGETITGEITDGDADWFKFEAEPGQVINLTATVDSDGKNRVELYHRSSSKNFQRVSGDTVQIGATATLDGTHYIRVAESGDAGTGYSIQVNVSDSDDFEPNENESLATRIDANATVSGEITINDRDWFAFDAAPGETIDLTVTAGSDGRNDVELYHRSCCKRGQSVSDGTVRIGATATLNGTHYIEVRELGRLDQGSGTNYTLDLRTYRTEPFEPNENASLATPLYDNPFTPSDARISIGDADYFEYRVEAGETINVTGGVPPGERSKRVYLDVPGGTNAKGIESGTFRTVEDTAESDRLYRLWIDEGRSGGPGPYNLTVTVDGENVGLPNDRFETANPPIGNQDRANATAIDSGRYGDLGMVDDDEDWFRFRAAQDARIEVNTSYNSSANDLAVEVVAPDGTTIQPSGDDDSLAVNTSNAGVHYLQVTGQPDAQVTYALELNVSASGPGALPGQARAPTDVDGDGRYEDVDGSGGLNVIDVSILLGVFDRVPSGEVPFYDFNDDGTLNILDVAALLDQT